jgi:hypothetical protein
MDDVVRTLLDALAAADECEPVELDFALQDHIDVIGESAEDHRADHVLVDTGDDFFDSFAKAWVE